ncbi:hypothetical protein LLEC1_08043 [Akanthomyces lecanii]|uniref:Uncharacterized protein n=1 Tax=Cordyceps confragosa TaxID=2714763 RepID=A0A179I888_CORDF|nr:hypothetical protein LLEC1_08043 [Akanthomyces lecanii]
MPETLLSILCSERWRWDSFASSEITFNQDGTGEALRDGAFRPKTYALRLEQGEFRAQSCAPEEGQAQAAATTQHRPRFQLRLTLDPSPYPPREEWLRPERAPDSMRFWEWTQFCSRQAGYF